MALTSLIMVKMMRDLHKSLYSTVLTKTRRRRRKIMKAVDFIEA